MLDRRRINGLLLATQLPMHRLIADAVHLIVCIDRINGIRRVTQIVSVRGHDGHAYQLQSET